MKGSALILTMWVIYDHPTDFPDSYVVRGWDVYQNGLVAHLNKTKHDSLEEARASLPEGLYNLRRDSLDDPCIAEVWV